MKYLMLVLALFALSACKKEDDVVDAKYLALNNCQYTGKSFESTDKVWVSYGRGGSWKEQTTRLYLYVCDPGDKITISPVRLILDKE